MENYISYQVHCYDFSLLTQLFKVIPDDKTIMIQLKQFFKLWGLFQ